MNCAESYGETYSSICLPEGFSLIQGSPNLGCRRLTLDKIELRAYVLMKLIGNAISQA